jgi:hypothetical protein
VVRGQRTMSVCIYLSLSTTYKYTQISMNILRSPVASPSVSASTPFNWHAARHRLPPPFQSPLQDKRNRIHARNAALATPTRRVVRRPGILERSVFFFSRVHFLYRCLTFSAQHYSYSLAYRVRDRSLPPQRAPSRTKDDRVADWRHPPFSPSLRSRKSDTCRTRLGPWLGRYVSRR